MENVMKKLVAKVVAVMLPAASAIVFLGGTAILGSTPAFAGRDALEMA